jgi:hypothetical protein
VSIYTFHAGKCSPADHKFDFDEINDGFHYSTTVAGDMDTNGVAIRNGGEVQCGVESARYRFAIETTIAGECGFILCVDLPALSAALRELAPLIEVLDNVAEVETRRAVMEETSAYADRIRLDLAHRLPVN